MTKKKLIFIIIFAILILAGLGYFIYQYFHPTKTTLNNQYTFICPVPAHYCGSGKIIKSQGQYTGIGYQLPAGTPILATFSGQATSIAISLSENIGGGQYPGFSISDNSDLEHDILLLGSQAIYL